MRSNWADAASAVGCAKVVQKPVPGHYEFHVPHPDHHALCGAQEEGHPLLRSQAGGHTHNGTPARRAGRCGCAESNALGMTVRRLRVNPLRHHSPSNCFRHGNNVRRGAEKFTRLFEVFRLPPPSLAVLH